MRFLLANKEISFFLIVSVCFLLLVVKYGKEPRLTYDSIAYIEASENFETYFHGKNAEGHSYLFRPPLIPLCLHFFHNKILAAKWLNAICYVLSLWLCYFIGRQFRFEPIFLLLFILLVGTSYPWVQNHFFVWSEPLFSTLLLLLIWMMVEQKSWLWIALLCVSLYFVRKAGLIIAAGIFCADLLNGYYKRAILVGLFTTLVVIFWESLTWIYSEGHTLKTIFFDSPQESKWQYFDVITAWFIPREIPLLIRIMTFCAITALLAVAFKEKFVQLVRFPEINLAIMVAVYISTFVVFWRLDYNEAERYLSVVIPPTMLLLVVLLRFLYQNIQRGKYLVWVIFILWLIYPISRMLYHMLG